MCSNQGGSSPISSVADYEVTGTTLAGFTKFGSVPFGYVQYDAPAAAKGAAFQPVLCADL